MENFKRIDLDQNEQQCNQYDLFAEYSLPIIFYNS